MEIFFIVAWAVFYLFALPIVAIFIIVAFTLFAGWWTERVAPLVVHVIDKYKLI